MLDNNGNKDNTEERRIIHLKMTLLSDTIFGNGMSLPGDGDILVLTDAKGFPYYKGSTFKGVLREEMTRIYEWEKAEDEKQGDDSDCKEDNDIIAMFGEGNSGTANADTNGRSLVFSDFTLSAKVKEEILGELGDDRTAILDCLTNMRAFTRISEEGTADVGSLRYARCVNKGLIFYGTITCSSLDEASIKNAVHFVKCIGTMRNRGFGNVRIEEETEKSA